ncbi:MAG: hypothetical protein K2X90_01765 [Candidatus Babeliaceae bacterium]|nr:hypothetical protein [Candidatus Babeliaceae bacterium]
MNLFSSHILLRVTLISSIFLYAETNDSKALVSYIQEHKKKSSTPLPATLKNRAKEINLLEEFLKNSTVSLEKIPAAIIDACKDFVFRDALFKLVELYKINLVSSDKIIQSIIKKLTEKDLYMYFSAKINFILSSTDAFSFVIKSASLEVKNMFLLELLLTTASEFSAVKDYQKTNEFKKNEAFIRTTITAGSKINDALNTLPTLGLSLKEQETFVNSLFAPRADFIEFLCNNGLDKNSKLPISSKSLTLTEFYENELKNITEKLSQIVSTDLKNAQEQCKKILAFIKPSPQETKLFVKEPTKR